MSTPSTTDGILASVDAAFIASPLRRAERTSVNNAIQACISNKKRERERAMTLTFLNFGVLCAGKTALFHLLLVYQVSHLVNKIRNCTAKHTCHNCCAASPHKHAAPNARSQELFRKEWTRQWMVESRPVRISSSFFTPSSLFAGKIVCILLSSAQ